MKTFVISDTHFGHAAILNFKRDDGITPVRNFSSVEAMDDFMVRQWNSVVSPEDKVYHLGDVSMKKGHLDTLTRLNGNKTLIAGNHDIFDTKLYLKYFSNVRGYRVLNTTKNKRIILSHIPICSESKGRFSLNVHGHLHQNKLIDPWYYNVSVEQINYTPLNIQTIFDFVDANDAQ